jgi:hypothetical protein
LANKDSTYKPLGASCMILGLAAILIAREYPYGTVTAMGPGFIPTAVAAILMLLGALILIAGGRDVTVADVAADETAADQRIISVGLLRAIVAIGGAIILFGLAIKPLGLGLTVFLATVIAGLGHPGANWRTLLLLALSLAVGSCLIFVVLLSQDIPMLPRFG